MIILLLFFVTLACSVWLISTFRKGVKKNIFLGIAWFLQLLGYYLIFQDAIKVDEQGLEGNIFGNPLALSLIALGIGIIGVLVIIFLSLKSKTSN